MLCTYVHIYATVIRLFIGSGITFRGSQLTRLLQNSIGGNAKTSIICTVAPTMSEETLNTLNVSNCMRMMGDKWWWYCYCCRRVINVYVGGNVNWECHLKSDLRLSILLQTQQQHLHHLSLINYWNTNLFLLVNCWWRPLGWNVLKNILLPEPH